MTPAHDPIRASIASTTTFQAEYAKLVDIVTGYDQRLLTIKGWGVTLSLASLVSGFKKQGHYGLFLVAAASRLAFWRLKLPPKIHQIHYYPRMGYIEFIAYELLRIRTPSWFGIIAAHRLGWAHRWAKDRRGHSKGDPREPHPWPKLLEGRSMQPCVYSHVMFPHVVAVVIGASLFILGLLGLFGPI